MENLDPDTWLRDALSQLDDDLQGALFEGSTLPSRRVARQRIHALTFARLGLAKPAPSRRTWRWTLATAGAAAAILTATLSGSVLATLGRVFHFVPGIGIVQQTAPGTPVAILTHPVRGSWHGHSIAVTGMVIAGDRATAIISGFPARAPASLTFQPQVGPPLTLTAWDGSSRAVTYVATTGLTKLGRYRSGILVLGAGDRIPVHLAVSPGVRELAKLGPTVNHHGIALTAVAVASGRSVNVTVIPESHGPFTVTQSIAPILPASEVPNVQVTDAADHHYTPIAVAGFNANSQIQFASKVGVHQYTLTIPVVSVVYPGQSTITVPIPPQGRESVNRTIRLAGFPITVTSVQRIHSGGFGLRVYLNLHPHPGGTRELYGLQWTNPETAYASQENRKTGVMTWIEEGIAPGQPAATLTFSQAQVYLRGPWTFAIHLPRH